MSIFQCEYSLFSLNFSWLFKSILSCFLSSNDINMATEQGPAASNAADVSRFCLPNILQNDVMYYIVITTLSLLVPGDWHQMIKSLMTLSQTRQLMTLRQTRQLCSIYKLHIKHKRLNINISMLLQQIIILARRRHA